MNRKGSSVAVLFLFVFVVFLFLVFFGIALLGFNEVNKALDQDVDIGQVNLKDVNDETFGALVTAMLNQADTLALAFIFGVILLMVFNAHFFGDSNKLWIPIDIVILIFVFILSVYFSSIYDTLINSSSVLDVYVDNLPKSSRLLLNLPLIVSTIGALLMIVTYIKVNADEGGRTNVLGFE